MEFTQEQFLEETSIDLDSLMDEDEIDTLFNWINAKVSQMQLPVMPMDDTIKILYEKLRTQISIYAGKRDGGLATLQDLYSALNDGETIICECCGQRITSKGGHLTGCDIVKRYFKAFGHSV